MPQNAVSADKDRLKPGFSLYCDALRFLAAMTVLCGHASSAWLSGGFLWQTVPLGHSAVMVFFVLSGFIIAYVSDTRENTLADYAVARLARLYSVVVPAVILSVVLDTIGMARDPSFYAASRESMPLLRALAALLFLSESWYLELSLFSNTAFWSLPFEFWYYVLFGAALFLRGRARILALLAASLIAGPTILIFFPIWLAGVFTYRQLRHAPPVRWAPLLFVISALIAMAGTAARMTGLAPVYDVAYLPPSFSLADYVIAAGVALNLLSASRMEFAFLRPVGGFIRAGAGATFSLYLFHLPIMCLVATFVPQQMASPARWAILVATAVSGAWLLSLVTERRKTWWRNAFAALLHRFARRPAAGTASRAPSV